MRPPTRVCRIRKDKAAFFSSSIQKDIERHHGPKLSLCVKFNVGVIWIHIQIPMQRAHRSTATFALPNGVTSAKKTRRVSRWSYFQLSSVKNVGRHRKCQ